jgi:ATP-dependent Clp protease ATP-binding subunit ClpC
MKNKVNDELKQHFRPEFLNRIDDTIVFHQLTEPEILQIVDLMVGRIETQLRNKDMGLELTDDAKLFLAKKGYDPVLGARPLRRTIQREIEDSLSERILFNELRPGQIVLVDCEGDPADVEHARLVFARTTDVGVPDDPGLVDAGATD